MGGSFVHLSEQASIQPARVLGRQESNSTAQRVGNAPQFASACFTANHGRSQRRTQDAGDKPTRRRHRRPGFGRLRSAAPRGSRAWLWVGERVLGAPGCVRGKGAARSSSAAARDAALGAGKPPRLLISSYQVQNRTTQALQTIPRSARAIAAMRRHDLLSADFPCLPSHLRRPGFGR